MNVAPGIAPVEQAVRFVIAHLDEPLPLERVARVAGLSAHHFHRSFKATLHETLARFVERLRLNRAANALVMHDATVLDIALASGYAHHETFSRAFRRHFGATPVTYRREGRMLSTGEPPDRAVAPASPFTLAPTRVQVTRPLRVASVRHLGAYEFVDPDTWGQVRERLDKAGSAGGALVGLALDAPGDVPGDVPADQLRFDAGLLVGPGTRADGIAVQTLPGRTWAVTLHVGAYHTLTSAYPQIVQQTRALPGYSIDAPPVMEVYHTERMAVGDLAYTDIYIPIVELDPALGCAPV